MVARLETHQDGRPDVSSGLTPVSLTLTLNVLLNLFTGTAGALARNAKQNTMLILSALDYHKRGVRAALILRARAPAAPVKEVEHLSRHVLSKPGAAEWVIF
jgi:hypothetical protein